MDMEQTVIVNGITDPEEARKMIFRAVRQTYRIRKRPNMIPNYDFNYDEEGFGSVSLAVEDQTAKHLSALDAELEKAVQDVQADSRWEARKSNQGGYFVTNGTIYLHSFNQEFLEAVAAFFAGDLLTALQKRQEVIDQIPVAP